MGEHEGAVAHGGLREDELEALGLVPEDVLDVSVNVNPYGPCPAIRRAIAEAPVHRYPDPSASRARRALASWTGVEPARVVVGNGAVDLLWSLARVLLGAGDPVLLVEPAFSEMRAAASRQGGVLVEHRTTADEDFALDVGALDARVAEVSPKLAYLCTPSNPAGACTPLAAIEALAERHPETLFVVDVSFLSLSERSAEGDSPRSTRIAWVRSLTKDHVLAGLRVGFAVLPAAVAECVEAARPPWSVNAPAQAAAVAATTDAARRFVEDSRERLLRDRAQLDSALAKLVRRVHPSGTVFSLVDLGPRVRAAALRRELLARHHVLVRDCTSFGLPHHVRIAARPRPETERVVAALVEELRR